MKTVLTTLTCLLLFVCVTSVADAQYIPDTARLAVGADFGAPTASISSRYVAMLGASLRFDLPFSKRSYFTASVGYNNFLLADGAVTTQQAILNVPVPTLETMPLKLGYKYFLFHRFYVQLELGETVILNKAAEYATKSSAFSYSPQIGMLFNLKNHNFIDAGIRYEGTSSYYNDTDKYNFWAAHISYAFKL